MHPDVTLILRNAPTQASQTAVRALLLYKRHATVAQSTGVVPNPPARAATARTSASMAVRLAAVRSLGLAPGSSSAPSRMAGLMNDATYACSQRVGASSEAFQVRATQGGVVVSQCIQASRLQLTNSNGGCVQTWLPKVQRVEVSGTRSVELFAGDDLATLPPSVDVRFSTWGTTGVNPNATRLLLHLSALRATGNAMRAGVVVVSGRLPYEVPSPGNVVLIDGCNVERGVVCDVRDSKGRPVCRYRDVCVDKVVWARRRYNTMRSAAPCSSRPGPV